MGRTYKPKRKSRSKAQKETLAKASSKRHSKTKNPSDNTPASVDKDPDVPSKLKAILEENERLRVKKEILELKLRKAQVIHQILSRTA
ncbi:hypothetical protein CPB83DRAFT_846816 [Crepidotus variabilis]|uniref:Uncharacterized protein n=1 Tax=Crepidotus variabilis TaxID=179855 RepID=A0A9P6JTE3_9AGAR|nr:hypothetical protein CPB83DRAFT_846816 [Crepidotus variabilis]